MNAATVRPDHVGGDAASFSYLVGLGPGVGGGDRGESVAGGVCGGGLNVRCGPAIRVANICSRAGSGVGNVPVAVGKTVEVGTVLRASGRLRAEPVSMTFTVPKDTCKTTAASPMTATTMLTKMSASLFSPRFIVILQCYGYGPC